MKFDIHLPSPRLRPFVRHFVISETGDSRIYPVLPGTGLVMGFQYRGRLSSIQVDHEYPLSISGITGMMDSYRIFRNYPSTGTVLVTFNETGTSPFIRQPLHELFGQSLALDFFFDKQAIRDTQERLSGATSDYERIGIVEEFLIGQWNERSEDALVVAALREIVRSKGTVRIGELASALHTSQSPLEKRFRSVIGASPKKFAGIVRARSMMEALQEGNMRNADYLSSFYDQAHFIKEFKKFTSLTPEQYLRSLPSLPVAR